MSEVSKLEGASAAKRATKVGVADVQRELEVLFWGCREGDSGLDITVSFAANSLARDAITGNVAVLPDLPLSL